MSTTLSLLRLPLFLLVGSHLAAGRGAAQTCPEAIIIGSTPVTTFPAEVRKVFLGSGADAAELAAPTTTGWTPTADERKVLATNQATQPSKPLRLARADGANVCEVKYTLAGGTGVTGGTPGTGGSAGSGGLGGNQPPQTTSTVPAEVTYAGPEECQSKAGPAWETQIKKDRKGQPGGFTLLVFMESGSGEEANVCYYNRDYGVVGDPIYVGVFRKTFEWQGVRFEPCSAQAAAPNILQSSDKFPTGTLQAGAWSLQKFLPRRCFNTAIDVSIIGQGRTAADVLKQRYPLTQYDRYRATLQAGILFTPLHDGDFALRADQADTNKKFIFDRGPSNRGPEYIATLQLYSILRYLPSIVGRPAYPGRDPINDQKFADRLGLILGVGIKNPAKRFVAGASFELIYGVSAIGVIDFAKVSRVHESISLAEPYLGKAETIPTTLSWKHRTTFGLSLDLRYVATLFTGNR